MPLQTSLSSDNFKKFKPLLCPPVAELQRLSRNVIRCLPLSRLPSTLPVKDKNSKPLRLHTCPKNSICLFLIVFNSDLWTFPSLNTFTLVFFSAHEILNIRLINHISAASIFFSMSLVIVQHSHYIGLMTKLLFNYLKSPAISTVVTVSPLSSLPLCGYIRTFLHTSVRLLCNNSF